MASLISGPQPGWPATSVNLSDLSSYFFDGARGRGSYCPEPSPNELSPNLMWPEPLLEETVTTLTLTSSPVL